MWHLCMRRYRLNPLKKAMRLSNICTCVQSHILPLNMTQTNKVVLRKRSYVNMCIFAVLNHIHKMSFALSYPLTHVLLKQYLERSLLSYDKWDNHYEINFSNYREFQQDCSVVCIASFHLLRGNNALCYPLIRSSKTFNTQYMTCSIYNHS